MGKIIKYNATKSGSSTRIMAAATPSAGYQTNDGSKNDKNDILVNLWGNEFNGINDIEDTMFVNGDIYISYVDRDDDDMDDEEDDPSSPPIVSDDDDDEDDDKEIPTGSLYVQNKIEGNSVYGKTVFIDYPEIDNEKTDILELFKDFDARVTQNRTDIDNIDARVTQNRTDINNIDARVTNNTTSINNILGDITEIKNLLSGIQDSLSNIGVYGGINQPVIIASGQLRRASDFSSSKAWEWTGQHLDCISLVTAQRFYPENGLMTMVIPDADGFNTTITSIQVIQRESGDTQNFLTASSINSAITNRNDGAHWFEAQHYKGYASGGGGTYGNRIFIREFHQSNGDNDSWASNDWGQNYDASPKSVYITIIGYATKT